MSRDLNDDFEDDALPGGALDLETGSHVGGGGAASSYGGGDGIDFDDELYGDGTPAGSLELDLPGGGATQARHAPSRQPPAAPQPSGGPVVPDLGPAPARAPAPRSSGSLPAPRTSGQMAAVRPSGQMAAVRPSGQMAAVRPSGELPASRPSGQMAPVSPSSGSLPPGSDPSLPPSSPSGGYSSAPGMHEPLPPPRPTAAAVIAKFPPAPEQIHKAPRYAVQVVIRQLELRSELESLRRRRSPDVALYEAALRAYDPKTFRLGMAINLAVLFVATFIFFLPVILRFMRAD